MKLTGDNIKAMNILTKGFIDMTKNIEGHSVFTYNSVEYVIALDEGVMIVRRNDLVRAPLHDLPPQAKRRS